MLDGAGAGVNVRSDALWMRMSSEDTEELAPTEGEVTRLRLIVEGERRFGQGARATAYKTIELSISFLGSHRSKPLEFASSCS